MNGDSERNETPRCDPSLLKFRLSTLLLVVAVCSGLFATMMTLGAIWSAILLFLIVIVGAHVAGNAIGTQLRAQGSSHPRLTVPALTSIQHVATADPPRLRNRSSLGRLTFIFSTLR